MVLPTRACMLTLVMLAGCHAARGPAAGNDAADDAPAANAATPARLTPLSIRTASGAHRFDVELAQTREAHEKGLSFRRALAPDSGMLFLFVPPQTATFWMKDTLIPLDMLFIRADGTIAAIVADATPNSLETKSAGEPVIAVLELAGGRAAALGIKAGDRVSWGPCVTGGAPLNDNSPILDFCPGAS